MPTIPVFRMVAPRLDRNRVSALAGALGLRGKTHDSEDAVAVQDEARVLVQAGPCAKLAGVILYVNHAGSLGAIHDAPIEPARAGEWLGRFLDRHDLNPVPPAGEHAQLEREPWARFTEAVVFDGRERRRVKARTDAGVRLRINGTPVSGPRTRIRAVFGGSENPLMVHVAAWERLETYTEGELIREHDVIAELERSMRGRKDCGMAIHVKSDVRLAYAATEEFRGSPDLLAPYYFVEIESPRRNDRPGAADPGPAPRQLRKLPAWR
jgi:hypothetical protein